MEKILLIESILKAELNSAKTNTLPAPFIGTKQGPRNQTPHFCSLSSNNGDTYEGIMFNNLRHGIGLLTWADGSTFLGTFVLDKKYGVGVYKSPETSDAQSFCGLYKNDTRFGFGVAFSGEKIIMKGVWYRNYLIKINHSIQCDELEAIKEAIVEETLNETNDAIIIAEQGTHEKTSFPSINIKQARYDEFCPLLHYASSNMDTSSKTFWTSLSISGTHDNSEPIIKMADNKSPLFLALRNHYEFVRQWVSGDMLSNTIAKAAINLENNKKDTKLHLDIDTGENDCIVSRYLNAAAVGAISIVEQYLHEQRVDVNVSDNNGNGAVLFATLGWGQPLVNLILDHGANINQLNDIGISCLTACLFYFYPVKGFTSLVNTDHITKGNDIIAKNMETAAHPSSQTTRVASPDEAGFEKTSYSTKLDARLKNLDKIAGTEQDYEDLINPSIKPQVKPKMSMKRSSIWKSGREDDDNESVVESLDEFESQKCVKNLPIQSKGLASYDKLVDACVKTMAESRAGNDLLVNPEGKVRTLAAESVHKNRMKSMISLLLRRGANPSISSRPYPALYYALLSQDVEMVRELIKHGANVRASVKGKTFLQMAVLLPSDAAIEMTKMMLDAGADPNDGQPLHCALSRDDNYDLGCQLSQLLLSNSQPADPSLLTPEGLSPMALAIMSGNDRAVQIVLDYGADPNQKINYGTPLCVALHMNFEFRRSAALQLKLVDKLVAAGGDLLAHVTVGAKTGNVVDYVHWVFNQDKRVAHLPYHALTNTERETYTARKALLAHVANLARKRAFVQGVRCCYSCGRTVGVRLFPCSRCKQVNYCSKVCKQTAWNSGHKDECWRWAGEANAGGGKRAESPTPTTNARRHMFQPGDPRIKALQSQRGNSAEMGFRQHPHNTIDNYSNN